MKTGGSAQFFFCRVHPLQKKGPILPLALLRLCPLSPLSFCFRGLGLALPQSYRQRVGLKPSDGEAWNARRKRRLKNSLLSLPRDFDPFPPFFCNSCCLARRTRGAARLGQEGRCPSSLPPLEIAVGAAAAARRRTRTVADSIPVSMPPQLSKTFITTIGPAASTRRPRSTQCSALPPSCRPRRCPRSSEGTR